MQQEQFGFVPAQEAQLNLPIDLPIQTRVTKFVLDCMATLRDDLSTEVWCQRLAEDREENRRNYRR